MVVGWGEKGRGWWGMGCFSGTEYSVTPGHDFPFEFEIIVDLLMHFWGFLFGVFFLFFFSLFGWDTE